MVAGGWTFLVHNLEKPLPKPSGGLPAPGVDVRSPDEDFLSPNDRLAGGDSLSLRERAGVRESATFDGDVANSNPSLTSTPLPGGDGLSAEGEGSSIFDLLQDRTIRVSWKREV